jgi:hypothetical protein
MIDLVCESAVISDIIFSILIEVQIASTSDRGKLNIVKSRASMVRVSCRMLRYIFLDKTHGDLTAELDTSGNFLENVRKNDTCVVSPPVLTGLDFPSITGAQSAAAKMPKIHKSQAPIPSDISHRKSDQRRHLNATTSKERKDLPHFYLAREYQSQHGVVQFNTANADRQAHLFCV